MQDHLTRRQFIIATGLAIPAAAVLPAIFVNRSEAFRGTVAADAAAARAMAAQAEIAAQREIGQAAARPHVFASDPRAGDPAFGILPG